MDKKAKIGENFCTRKPQPGVHYTPSLKIIFFCKKKNFWRTNCQPCCPPMSNPSTSPWTARP